MTKEEKIELDTPSPAAEKVSFRLETYEGPLDLLLDLIHKNKMSIGDIQISVICEQYFAYLEAAQRMDLELTSEFILMASELMLIKSKMLLPREEEAEEDPRAELAEAIARLEAAKRSAAMLAARYPRFMGRMEKEQDDISPDRTFVAEGQDVQKLYALMRRLLAEVRTSGITADELVKPLVARPVVSVELKILGILKHFEGRTDRSSTLGELLMDAADRSELVAIFIGVLELIKMKRLIMVSNEEEFETLGGISTDFVLNPDFADAPADGIAADSYTAAPAADAAAAAK